MALVAPRLHVAAGIVVGAALALVVNELAIGEEGPAFGIERRQLAKGEVVKRPLT